MSPSAIDIRTLSVAERIQLAEDLWDSIATGDSPRLELSAEQQAEVDARVAAHELDPASAEPWDQVRARLFDSGDR